MLSKIVSGGQSGVDRGALDAAIALRLGHGGWCPRGRRAEDGVIADRYQLSETMSACYAVRTSWNVRDSDGTLVLTQGVPEGGTRLTMECARRYGRPFLVVKLDGKADIIAMVDWIQRNCIRVLNVAGPRESSGPGIGKDARHLVAMVIEGDRKRTPEGS